MIIAGAFLFFDPSNLATAASSLKCKTIDLNPTHRKAALDFELNTGGIINSGPGSIVIETLNDLSLHQVIKPSKDVTVFFGDTRFIYTLGLVQPTTRAKVLECTTQAKENVYAPALCILYVDQFPTLAQELKGAADLGITTSVAFPPGLPDILYQTL